MPVAVSATQPQYEHICAKRGFAFAILWLCLLLAAISIYHCCAFRSERTIQAIGARSYWCLIVNQYAICMKSIRAKTIWQLPNPILIWLPTCVMCDNRLTNAESPIRLIPAIIPNSILFGADNFVRDALITLLSPCYVPANWIAFAARSFPYTGISTARIMREASVAPELTSIVIGARTVGERQSIRHWNGICFV